MKNGSGRIICIAAIGLTAALLGLGSSLLSPAKTRAANPLEDATYKAAVIAQSRADIRRSAIACCDPIAKRAWASYIRQSIEHKLQSTSGAGPAQLLMLELDKAKKDGDLAFEDCYSRLDALKEQEKAISAAGDTGSELHYWKSLDMFQSAIYTAACNVDDSRELSRLDFMARTHDLCAIMAETQP